MPEVQEVFQMATQKVKPDPGALERQHQDQRQRAVRQKATVFALVGALMLMAAGVGISILLNDPAEVDVGGPGGPSSSSVPLMNEGASLEPGRYRFETADPDFDASYRLTMEVPDGYEGIGAGALKMGTNQTGVSAWLVGDAFADPCHRAGSEVDPTTLASADGLVAALVSQESLDVTTPAATTIDGFPATYMERTVAETVTPAFCDEGEFRVWVSTDGGGRYLAARGQLDLLWIVDVDGGRPLVIDASLDFRGTEQDRADALAELEQMVDSIRIEPIGATG